MARYIDADDLKKIIRANNWSNPAVPDVVCVIIDRSPSADVVPKSEVEYWKEQCFHACMNNGCLDLKIITGLFENADGHNDPVGEKGEDGLESSIRYAKAEIAREIFEEIEEYAELQLEALNIAGNVEPRASEFFAGGQQAFCLLLDHIAERKKKYYDIISK